MSKKPETGETYSAHGEGRLLSGIIGAESSWRVVCVPETRPAAFGLAQVATLADELTSESAAPSLLVWRSQRALVVTRQDTHLPRFSETSDQMAAAGWPVVLRKSGGGACPIGPGTVQVAAIEAVTPGATMNAKYAALTELILSTLHSYGVIIRTGAVAHAYCPGSYDLAIRGKKIAGMSQHWFRNRSSIRCVVTAASINVEEAPESLADAVNRFYLGVGSPVHCEANSLTSMRLCDSDVVAALRNLVPAIMDRIRSCARGSGNMVRPTSQRVPQAPVYRVIE